MWILTPLLTCIRRRDLIAPKGYSKLHIDGDRPNQTYIGGLATICIQIILLYIALSKFCEMVYFTNRIKMHTSEY